MSPPQKSQAMASWQTSFVGSVGRFCPLGWVVGDVGKQKKNTPGGAIVFLG